MSTATLYDTGAPTLEVRIYDQGRLLARQLCESEEDAGSVIERWQDVANLFVVADDAPSTSPPGDILEFDDPPAGSDERYCIADAPVPSHGTE